MITTIYLTRHGFRSNWLTDQPQPDPPTGIAADVVLAEHGLDQAEELAQYLATIEPKIQRIYSSPFYRCLQTINPIAEKLDLQIFLETGFGEHYDRKRETHPQPAPTETLKTFFPRVNKEYKSLFPTPVDGETYEELHERGQVALQRVLQDINTNNPEINTIIIVTHAATEIALGRALLADPNFEIRTGTCSLSVFKLRHGSKGALGDWSIETNGDAHYLANGEEMHWSFENLFDPGSTEDAESRKKLGGGDIVSVYLPLDLSQAVSSTVQAEFTIAPNDRFQVVGLDQDNPLFRIGDEIYEGVWQDLVGTELYSTLEGDVIGKSRQRIHLKPGQLKPKSQQTADSTVSSGWVKRKTLLERIQEINQRRASGTSGDIKVQQQA